MSNYSNSAGVGSLSSSDLTKMGYYYDINSNSWNLDQSSIFTNQDGSLNATGVANTAIGGVQAISGLANVGVGIANAIDSAKNNKLYRQSLQQQIEYNKENQEYLRSERNRLNKIRSNTSSQFSSGTSTRTSY